jgi:ubiquinone/menaquinone biosynthesis C-methylase UbiE
MNFFYEIFDGIPRLAPGSEVITIKAFNTISDFIKPESRILDIGCGLGQHTKLLAKLSNANVYALDNHKPYLAQLKESAESNNIKNIETVNASMFDLPFKQKQFELIWCEAAIYNIGFKKGLEYFRNFLKDNSYMAVSEVSWTKKEIPEELKTFWDNEYPYISTIEYNIKLISRLGFSLLDFFQYPVSAWLDNYYIPLEKRLINLQNKYSDDNEKIEMINSVKHEINTYRKYYKYYNYVFYIMKNR